MEYINGGLVFLLKFLKLTLFAGMCLKNKKPGVFLNIGELGDNVPHIFLKKTFL